MSNRWYESVFGFYSRIALSERGGYRLARLIRRLRSQAHWQDDFKTPDGFQLNLNLGIYPDICMAYGLYELSTVRLIKKILSLGDHFVDAGANIGYLTLHSAKRVGPNGQVDAFEPEAGNRCRLNAHLHANQLQNRVTVHPYALSDHQGQVTLYRWPEDDLIHNHGCTSQFTNHRESAQAMTVECRTLDQMLQGVVPKLIKMDVEGAEPIMVQGMIQTLESNKPPIIIGELNPTQARVAGFAPHQWICSVLDIQPKYKVYTIGSRIRQRKLKEIAELGEINLLLKV